MAAIISCSASAEGPAFFDAVGAARDSTYSIAVSLSFDWRVDDEEGDPAAAKQNFIQFLDALPRMIFRLYYLYQAPPQNNVTPAPVLRPVPVGHTVAALGTPAGTQLAAFKSWLDLRAQNRWISSAAPSGAQVDANAIDAAGLLKSAATWAAPIPQDLGLVRTVRIKVDAPPLTYLPFVVIPFLTAPDGADLPLRTILAGGIYEFDYKVGNPFGTVVGVANSVPSGVEDPASLIDPNTAFLIARPDADAIYNLLKKIEDRSASLLWAFHPLLMIDWMTGSVDSVKHLVWRTLNGLSTLLDPLLISLRMNGADQEGPFLSALASCIEGRVSGGWTQATIDSIRGALKSKLTPSPQENDPLGQSARSDLVKLLASLFDLDMSAAALALIPMLLQTYMKKPPANLVNTDLDPKGDLYKRFTSPLEVALSNELQALAQKVQSEAGIEAMTSKLLKAIGVTADQLRTWAGGVGAVKDYQTALDDFQSLLDNSFNGFDATRSAQAAVYRNLLIASSSTLAVADLSQALTDSNWFTRRMNLSTGGAFDGLAQDLPVYAQAALDAADQTLLRSSSLDSAFKSACQELLADPRVGRFVPDHYPQPLPIQIAVDTNIKSVDDFARAYNGVGLVVRRSKSNWAHANLAMLSATTGSHSVIAGPTLLPLQPVAVDGQHRLFFEYTGSPLASNEFAQTKISGDTGTEQPQLPFYTYSAPNTTQLGPQERLPALYYGVDYDVAGFLISKGGSAPKGIQKSPEEAWGLANRIAFPGGTQPLFKNFPYRRTTAIGRIAIVEPQTTRIGADIPGVQALARDFPRLGFSAQPNRSAVQDLLRNTDGSGAFTLPTNGAVASIGLEDMWWWTGSGALSVGVFSAVSVNPNDAPEFELSFRITDAFAGKSLRITISGTGEPTAAGRTLTFTPSLDNATGTPKQVPVGNPLLTAESIWLRIRIVADNKGVSFSLADPSTAHRTQHSASRPGSDGLLLIAPPNPKANNEWQPQYVDPVQALIGFPKMGFLDFDRWFSNLDLRKIAWDDDADQEGPKAFAKELFTNYLLRHTNDKLAAVLDTLPDLAVDQLLIELTPLDDLSNSPAKAVISSRRAEFLPVELTKLGPRWKSLNAADSAERLQKLAVSHSAVLTILGSEDTLALAKTRSTTEGPEWKITAIVPRGMVARLTIRPLVPKIYIDTIFTERMRTLATELRNDHYVFEGASVLIECMLGALAIKLKSGTPPVWQDPIDVKTDRCPAIEKLVTDVVQVQWANTQRGYDLVAPSPSTQTNADAAWRWRRLGTVDIQTQRWRFMGRPIYSWFEPKKHHKGRTLPPQSAVVPLDSSGPVLDFDREIFFDRDDQDVDTRTLRLSPDSTLLQSFPWESASSTWFRHRVSARSRYAGALIASDRQPDVVRGWGDDPAVSRPAWIRVAVLADPTRLQLTRPQLRALIPLTVSPRANSNEAIPPAPPILAVLDERPFAHGGLADRIGSEIKTSIGYTLSGVLSVDDTRKEFGPDPRLSYRPTLPDLAKSMTLRAEGPVGLTFDTDSVRTPAFANAAMTLQPLALNGTETSAAGFEEHFVSVALRRYLDPSWLPDATASASLPLDTPWWLESTNAQDYKYDGQTVSLCSVSVSTAMWKVSVGKRYLDTAAEGDNTAIDVCTVSTQAAASIAVLLSPLEPGRASLSIFAQPPSNSQVTAGAGTLPLMMASVDVLLRGAKTITLPRNATARVTSASPVTSMNWTRTGKHFDVLHAGQPDDSPLEPRPTDQLVVRRGTGKYTFAQRDDDKNVPLSFEPASGRYPNPLHVHRHHALIVTQSTTGPGLPIEVFIEALRLFGREFSLQDGMSNVRLVEFETPALPLSFAVAGTRMFDTAHFDLLSIGRTDTTKLAGFSLFLRLLGDGATKPFTSLVLSVAFISPTQTQKCLLTIKPTETSPKPPLRGLNITLNLPASGAPMSAAQSVYCGGTLGTLDASIGSEAGGAAPPIEPTLTAIEVSIHQIVGISGEIWADLSLLSIPKSSGFSFDWFFTGDASSTLPPSAAVTPASLRGLIEAEARIIAVTPAIPVAS